MSTEDQNRCVVTADVNVDVDALMDDIVSGRVLGRRVEMFNEKNDSERNFDVVLTRAEAEILKQDPRVVDVRYGSKIENGIFLRHNSIVPPKLYSRSTTNNNTHYPWSFIACSSRANPFTGTDTTTSWPYTLTGQNVDVVIQDSGIEVGHPEWLDLTGTTSRLQQINWPQASGQQAVYTQGAQHYTDQYGHGTHCAGTVAGRRYGWAKSADIYAIKIFDTDAFGVSASFNMIRLWHAAKTNNRPTIVNMSWGYYNLYSNIVSGVYRGTPWTATAANAAYGMVQTVWNYDSTTGFYTHPVRVASVDADIASAVNAGVIFVAAAGNDTHKIDQVAGQDYNNSFTTSGGLTRYYHRGSTPTNTSQVITVGAVQAANTEYKSSFSCTGPGVDIYAPGEAIQSAIPVTSTLSSGAVTHPDNANFKIKKLQGTSMACPQVAGVLACLLEARPKYTPQDCKNWIKSMSTLDRLQDSLGGYTDTQSLQGSENRYLHWPYSQLENPLKVNRTQSP